MKTKVIKYFSELYWKITPKTGRKRSSNREKTDTSAKYDLVARETGNSHALRV